MIFNNKKGIIDIGFYVIIALIILNIILFLKSSVDNSMLFVFALISIILIILSWAVGGILFGVVGMEIGVILALLFSLWLIQSRGVIFPFLT